MSSNPFDEVPVLPVVVPVGVVVFVVHLILLLKGGRFTLPRAAVAAAIAVYAAGIFANTLFPIFLHPMATDGPWVPAVALIPFHDYELSDALTNVLVFVPLGILIPLLMRRPSWWKVLLIALAVSATMELLQLAAQRLFSGGHVTDINDLIWNIAGGVTGYIICTALEHAPLFSAFLDRFRWHSTAETARAT